MLLYNYIPEMSCFDFGFYTSSGSRPPQVGGVYLYLPTVE